MCPKQKVRNWRKNIASNNFYCYIVQKITIKGY